MDELLKLESLSVDYNTGGGALSAVKDVSLSVGRGEIYALVGESGCGKSTIAHAVTRLLDDGDAIARGRILFEGEDLLTYSEKRMEHVRGREIGMIFQNPLDSLNPVYRSGDQVEEAMKLDGVGHKEAVERIRKLYEALKIPDAAKRAESYPHELSGGMRQRVMIAIMLARNPKLLIADEPTTALDVTVEAEILKILRSLKENEGTSVLVITHNFGIVAEIADRVGVMYAGTLVEEATATELFRRPLHPYTKALMSALPRIYKSEGRIASIPGSVPHVIGDAPGCRFANRCACASDICSRETPVVKTVAPGHSVCCHLEVEI